MTSNRPVALTVDDHAVAHLLQFCQETDRRALVLVADANTYAVLGQEVESALRAQGFDLKSVVLRSAEVVADAQHIFRVLLQVDQSERTFIAVGSGTITDITRFVSHRTRRPFIAMPTAPSVDGFTSIGAPLIIDGIKTTVICQAPLAIFAELKVLAAAPRPMIAAGLGDMLGKFTSIADFRLGHLLWHEPYDEEIAQRTLRAAQLCVDHAEEIAQATPAGIRILLDALIESGFCMLDFGNSRPASGIEHHTSHVWEMKLLQAGRPAILHGAKVGYATILAAQLYERVRQTPRGELIDLLEAATLPDREQEIAAIRTAYGALADEMITAQQPFLNLTAAQFDAVKQKILAHWAEIQTIAQAVPTPEQCTSLLRTVGGPVTPAELGLATAEVAHGVNAAHYLRDRFTVRKLWHLVDGDQ
jgi:glycerol-1-phosphate dehydrogenase [NAD(P)+]